MARASAPCDLRFAQSPAGHLDVRSSPPGILNPAQGIPNDASKSGGARSPDRLAAAIGGRSFCVASEDSLLDPLLTPLLGMAGPAQPFPLIQDILTKIE